MRLASGDGGVALWGWGREGRAAHRAIRSRLPALPLTLLCSADEAIDANALDDPGLVIETGAAEPRLSAFGVVIKSPGISPYGDAALAAAAGGTRFLGGTSLWFAERPDARTACVTGTKGKSTTTALLAHLLRAGGHRVALAGNIGLPLLELLDEEADVWAIELSSYQTRDVADSGVSPGVAVVTNIFPEHLDWHGSEQRYVDDKLALVTDAAPGVAVLNAEDPTLRGLAGARPEAKGSTGQPGRARVGAHQGDVRWFNAAEGWHLRGDVLYRGGRRVFDAAHVPLPGRHNRGNLCAALAAIDALDIDAAPLAAHAQSFRPLPHRLQTLGAREGTTWVNDSISTTPHATLAALDVFAGTRVALLVGGHDRGLDWSAFADAMRSRRPDIIVTMGQNGGRIHALLKPLGDAGLLQLRPASDLGEAVAHARAALAGEGVLLMSPGAPSYGAYRDFTERGRHFARLGGFDPGHITSIDGIGIA